MAVDIETPRVIIVPVDAITSRVQVRSVKPSGVERLKAKIEKMGFLPERPLLVIQKEDGTLELVDGNHRLEAVIPLGITSVPVHIIEETLTDNEKKRRARQANEAAETIVPTTFVDEAEFVWRERKKDGEEGDGKTLVEIADILGWTEAKTKQYSALSAIGKQAWKVIVTAFENGSNSSQEDAVTEKVTGVTFSEYLLRSILSLRPLQQVELVSALASTDKKEQITKGKFNELAKAYRARNEAKRYAMKKLGGLGYSFLKKLCWEINKGAYDKDWEIEGHPKLEALIQAVRDEWEKKHSIRLLQGDFYEKVKEVGDESVNLVLTDPPYNVARDDEFPYAGRSTISLDFGEWDKYEPGDFIALMKDWAQEWHRILKPHGSGYVFTSDQYLSHLIDALTSVGFYVRAVIVWHKTNPGTNAKKVNFTPSTEFIVFFTKSKSGHTFRWMGENEMHNHVTFPICSGDERLQNEKKKTLHPTQKPESIIRHFMEISSNMGDTVFDGFAGVFTTGVVAKRLGRKFIGIEQDEKFFEAGKRRVEEAK